MCAAHSIGIIKALRTKIDNQEPDVDPDMDSDLIRGPGTDLYVKVLGEELRRSQLDAEKKIHEMQEMLKRASLKLQKRKEREPRAISGSSKERGEREKNGKEA